MKRLILISLLVLAAVSCGRQGVERPDDARGITLSMTSKALFAASGNAVPSCVLVAGSADYAAMGTRGLTPYHECHLEDIYKWNGLFYNTYKPYPQDNSRVYIFGYAPEDRLETTDSWKTLTPACRAGEYSNEVWEDILLTAPVSGTLASPVEEPLVYSHPVARFRFLAFKEESMVNYHVRDVVLTADPSLVPHHLTWNGAAGIWRPESNGTDGFSFKFETPGEHTSILGRGQAAAIVMSPYYVIPRDNNFVGPFTIEATYYIEGDEASRTLQSKTGIFFQISSDRSGNPVSRIRAGEDYAVLIRFNQDSFTLSGVRLDDWEDGGNIIVPVINETNEW